MLRRIAGWSGAVVVATALTSGAVEVSIDMGRTFQTIDGMGAMHDIKTFKVRQGPFLVDADMTNTYDSLINVMGFTIHRRFIEGGELAPSPGVFTISDGMRHFYGTTVRRMKEFADANQEPYMVAPAILTPPHYMKYNNKNTSGSTARDTTNRLNPEYHDDFGVFCAKYLETVKDSFGIACYAFSIQNEPMFNEPYSSCNYRDGYHYAEVLAEVGPRVRATGLGTLLYGVEHMYWAYPQWERQVMANEAVAPYLDRFAVHGYSDGVQVDTNSYDPTNPGVARPLWMSETGGGTEDHDAAMLKARMLSRYLTRGGISAWIHVSVGSYITGDDGSRTPLFWTFAQFFRFVRPQMERIDATWSDDDLEVAAFKDDGRGAFSVVIINSGTVDKSVNLSIAGGSMPDTLEKRHTSPTDKFVYDGNVEPTATITVPANGIVSLGCGHRNSARPVGIAPRAAKTAAAVRTVGTLRVYDLRGRAVHSMRAGTAVSGVRTMNRAGMAHGVYCVQGLKRGSKATAVVVSPVR